MKYSTKDSHYADHTYISLWNRDLSSHKGSILSTTTLTQSKQEPPSTLTKRELAHELNGVKDFPASPKIVKKPNHNKCLCSQAKGDIYYDGLEHVSTTALSISTIYLIENRNWEIIGVGKRYVVKVISEK